MTKLEEYHQLCKTAVECKDCPNVFHKLTYLNMNNGDINSPIMFIGEAPGFVRNPSQRLKSFYGNQSGWNFEHLLRSIGINRDSVFVSNAVLHTPVRLSDRKYDDDYGFLQIRPPSKGEIVHCGKFLRAQLALVNPKIICTLGRAAITACQLVLPGFPQYINLYHMVGKPLAWNDRAIFPFYHTSPNVTSAIRTLDQMEKDFQNLRSLIDEWKIKI